MKITSGGDMMQRISGKTKLVALLGDPVELSLSPQMHNHAFEYLGLNYAYLSLNVKEDQLPEAIAGMRALNAHGFNVTMPHKENVIQFLDEVVEEARWIGSVNTVLNDNGRLIGYNTDGKGYIRSLQEEGISIRGKKVVMAGAGGAARSIVTQLAIEGVQEIVLLNRSLEKAEAICDIVRRNISVCKTTALTLEETNLRLALEKSDIFINATPLGMDPYQDQCIISTPDMLHPDLVVSDLIYKPKKTKLLEMAEQIGCRTMNGLGMLIWQGALAFEIWTKSEMPVDHVKKVVFHER